MKSSIHSVLKLLSKMAYIISPQKCPQKITGIAQGFCGIIDQILRGISIVNFYRNGIYTEIVYANFTK